ncbi:MAG TPA: type II toxin-antitoxin system Phd/YefM family antitoxin, partial [Ligilactobacillus aviarius]|nr:type II toxin-antitoxin system Phd/YefM family antitoxin [Ligilactobacillus aviarius]
EKTMKLINNHTSLDETAYLLKNKQNREFLHESIHQLQDGNVKTLTPDDWENLKNTWNINE